MKKSSPKLNLGELSRESLDTTPVEKKNNKNNKKKTSVKKKKNGSNAIKKFFRDIISELKKVSWGKLKSTKNTKGVLNQTGIVLILVLAAIIVLTAIDLGLAELLKLLIQVGA